MYHYIFFDLDGTLTDSKEGILNSLRYAFDKLGEPVPPESTLIKFIGPPLQDSFAEFCGFSAERAAEAIAVFRERYALPCVMSTADISEGSSGGALLNVYGQAVAVTSGAYVYGNSMYLAVPIDPILTADLTGEGLTLPEVLEAETVG